MPPEVETHDDSIVKTYHKPADMWPRLRCITTHNLTLMEIIFPEELMTHNTQAVMMSFIDLGCLYFFSTITSPIIISKKMLDWTWKKLCIVKYQRFFNLVWMMCHLIFYIIDRSQGHLVFLKQQSLPSEGRGGWHGAGPLLFQGCTDTKVGRDFFLNHRVGPARWLPG